MTERGPLTEMVLELRKRRDTLREEMKKIMPVPFMQEKVAARQIRQRYGMEPKELKRLQELHGKDTVNRILTALEEV